MVSVSAPQPQEAPKDTPGNGQGAATKDTISFPQPSLDSTYLESLGDLTAASLDPLNYFLTSFWVWSNDASGTTWSNRAALKLCGQSDPQSTHDALGISPRLNGKPLDEVFASTQVQSSSKTSFVNGILSFDREGEQRSLLCRCAKVAFEGNENCILIEALSQPDDLSTSQADRPLGQIAEAAPSKIDPSTLILHNQNEVLDLMGQGADLLPTLDCIAVAIEGMIPEALALIMLYDRDREVLQFAAAPQLPSEASAQLECVEVASPGSAFARALDTEEVVELVTPPSEAGADELYEILHKLGLRQSVTKPIHGRERRKLGTLTLLFKHPLAMDSEQELAISAMIGLAQFAIETDQQKRQLRAANERFSSLASTIPGVVYQRVVRPDGDIRYTYISDGAKDLFGVAPSEIIDDPQALFDCHGPEYYATFRERLIAASKALKIWDVEATIITRDGERKFTHAIARPHKEPDGSVVWNGVILDATRIKEAELAAAAAEAKTREAIVESIPQGFILFDRDDRMVTCNSHFLNFYPHLTDLATSGASYEEIQKSIIGIELGSGDQPVTEQSLEKQLKLRRQQHDDPHYVVEQRLTDGRWILINEERTEAGGTVILLTDVSELKRREAELERSNRELQDFASVASHDLQEPLRKIEAFGDRLAAKCGEQLSDDGKMYLDRMQNAAGRMRSLINALLSYSRVTTKAKPFVQVDLNQLLSDILSDLQVTVEDAGASVEVEDLPTIDADPMQLQLLVQNIVSNAIKFRREGVAPEITVASRCYYNTGKSEKFDLLAGDVCELSISDNGIGFDMKYLDRIFNIFQRLHGKNDYPGTGIGLATCRKIAERHHGIITAESEPDEGSKFLITLPIKQASTEHST